MTEKLIIDEANMTEGQREFQAMMFKDTEIPDYYYKIITKILRPLAELSELLSEKQVLDAKMNDLIYSAENIAIGVDHLPEQFHTEEKKLYSKILCKENKDLEVIHDLSDSIKHTTLKQAERNCSILSVAMIEVNDDNKFKFLKNKLFVNHKGVKYDFMEIVTGALEFIGTHIGIKFSFKIVKKKEYNFEDRILLPCHNKFQSRIKHRSFQVVKKNEQGKLIPHPGEYKLGLDISFEADAKGWRLGPLKQKE